MFAIATDTRPRSAEDYAKARPSLMENREFGVAYCSVRILPPPESLLVDEIPWAAVSPPKDAFDYVLLANINTGNGLLCYGRTPHMIHANHSEEDMEVFITPAGMWSDSHHVIWVVAKEVYTRGRYYDVTFEIPDIPWSEKPPTWGLGDYGDGETPPFRTK